MLLAYLPAIALKATAAERDADRTRSLFSHNALYLFDPLKVLRSLQMSGRVESGILDEGDSTGLPQDSFENNFRDMFLIGTHI